MERRAVLLCLVCVACSLQTGSGNDATLTLLKEESQTMDAVCLDGTPPGYYLRPATGDGGNRWMIYLKGGGWCLRGIEDCYHRSHTELGSTKYWNTTISTEGILSDDPTVNPDFHDWNMVYVIYCDGASFAGNRKQPVQFNGTNLHFKGYNNLKAVITHLNKQRGMLSATDIVLTGSSAGGLAVYLHADTVKSMVSQTAKFRALPDAGYFIDIADVDGVAVFIEGMTNLMQYQNISEALSSSCLEKYSSEKWKCIFAPYLYQFIQTPMFVLNSMYDTAQLKGIYQLHCLPPNCTDSQMKQLEHFHEVFVEKISPVLSSSNGYYFDSCLVHVQSKVDKSWSTFQALGHPMRESFADWYFEHPSPGNTTQVKDCDYPCNKFC